MRADNTEIMHVQTLNGGYLNQSVQIMAMYYDSSNSFLYVYTRQISEEDEVTNDEGHEIQIIAYIPLKSSLPVAIHTSREFPRSSKNDKVIIGLNRIGNDKKLIVTTIYSNSTVGLWMRCFKIITFTFDTSIEGEFIHMKELVDTDALVIPGLNSTCQVSTVHSSSVGISFGFTEQLIGGRHSNVKLLQCKLFYRQVAGGRSTVIECSKEVIDVGNTLILVSEASQARAVCKIFYIIAGTIDEFPRHSTIFVLAKNKAVLYVQPSWDLLIEVKSVIFNEVSTQIKEVKDIQVEDGTSLSAIIRREDDINYLMTIKLSGEIYRQYREQVKGEEFLFLNLNIGYARKMLISVAKDPFKDAVSNIFVHDFVREQIYTDFTSILIDKQTTEQIRTVTYVGSKDYYVTFHFEIIKSLENFEIMSLWRSLNLYRNQRNTQVYLPFESLNLRLPNPYLWIDAHQSTNNLQINVTETFLMPLQQFDISEYNITDKKISRITFEQHLKQAVKVLTHEIYLLLSYQNKSFDLFQCIPQMRRGNIECKPILTNKQVYSRPPMADIPSETMEVIDFYCLHDHSGSYYNIVLMGTGEHSIEIQLWNHHITKNDNQHEVLSSVMSTGMNVIHSSFMVENNLLLFLGICRYKKIFQGDREDEFICKFYHSMKEKQFYGPFLSDDEVWLPMANISTVLFTRQNFYGISYTKVDKDTTFVFNLTIRSFQSYYFLTQFSVSPDLYIVVGLAKTGLVAMHKFSKQITLWSKSKESTLEILHYLVNYITDFSDITWFRSIGKLGYLGVGGTTHVLDLTSGGTDPLKRVMRVYEQERCRSYGKPKFVIPMSFSSGPTHLGVMYYENNDEQTKSLPAQCFDGFILDMFGPNYYANFNNTNLTHRSPKFRMILSSDKNGFKTTNSSGSLHLSTFSPLLVVGPNLGKKILHKTRNRYSTLEESRVLIKDLIVTSSHVAGYDIIPENNSIVSVTPAILPAVLSANKTTINSIPKRLYQPSEQVARFGPWIFIIGKGYFDIYRADVLGLTPGTSSSGLVSKVLFNFSMTNFVIPTTPVQNQQFFTLTFFARSEFDSRNIIIYAFDFTDPSKYSFRVIENACSCYQPGVEVIYQTPNKQILAVQYLRKSEFGNSITVGKLTLTVEQNETSTTITGAAYLDSTHTQQIPHKVLEMDMIASAQTLLQYFFIQNSGHIGIIALYYSNTGTLLQSRYQMIRFSEDLIITKNTLINCRPDHQELAIECIFFTPTKVNRISQVAIKFTLDAEVLGISKSEYSLHVPPNYSVVKIFKGIKTDTVLAMVEDSDLSLLFYDPQTGRVISELSTLGNSTRRNTLRRVEKVVEVTPSNFVVFVSGLYFYEMVFRRQEAEIKIIHDGPIERIRDYRLVVKGLEGLGHDVDIGFELLIEMQEESEWNFIMWTALWLVVAFAVVSLCLLKYSQEKVLLRDQRNFGRAKRVNTIYDRESIRNNDNGHGAVVEVDFTPNHGEEPQFT
jgi:hypothetical protein